MKKVNFTKIKRLNEMFESKQEFILYINNNIKNLNCQFFNNILEEIYFKNIFIPFYDNYVLKFLSKNILKLEGRISQEIYWKSRGWSNYNELYKISQTKGSISAREKNSHKGKFTIEWFINKYGIDDGPLKYKEHHEKRLSQCSNEVYLQKYGQDYVDNLNFLKSGSLEKFIHIYGEELGSKKYREFCSKCATYTEEFHIKKFGSNGSKIFRDKKLLRKKERLKKSVLYPKDVGMNGLHYNHSIGKNEIKLLNIFSNQFNKHIQFDKILGMYYPDGYIEETNTVVEVFEKYHLNDKQHKRDKRRLNFFKKRFNCNIIIIFDISKNILNLHNLDYFRNNTTTSYYLDNGTNLTSLF